MQPRGINTSEFWLSIIVVLFICIMSGIQVYKDKFDINVALSLVFAALTAIGYNINRTNLKNNLINQDSPPAPPVSGVKS